MISRQRRWQIKKKAGGMCVICGKPRINAGHCEEHRQQQSELKARVYHEKRLRNEVIK